jgi:hypothetical protein
MGTLSLLHFQICIQALSFVSNYKLEDINVNLFYVISMLTKNEGCENARINPKLQVTFVHIITNVIFKYMGFIE